MILAAALGCPLPAGAVEIPFAPVPSVVDYVATSVLKDPKRRDRNTVRHHAGWSRIDSEFAENYRTISYVNGAIPVSITVTPGPSGKYRSLRIRRGADMHRSHGWTYDAYKTGEQDVILGESCEVWNVAQHVSYDGFAYSRRELDNLRCISSDGIELWRKYKGNNHVGSWFEATHLERRPVTDSEVRPPADLLAWQTWAGLVPDPVGPADAPGDAVVTMQADNQQQRGGSRIVRRHHPWIYTENIAHNGKRTLVIENDETKLILSLEKNPDGQFAGLVIEKRTPAKSHGMTPVSLGRTETILGESCNWFDMTPGMMDAGRSQCRTSDGLVLKDSWASRSTSVTMVATRIDRAPVPLADVQPPSSVFVKGNWGIAD